MVRANINIIIKDGKYSFQSTNGHNYVVIGEIAELVGSLCTLNDSVNEFYGNIDSETLGNFVLNLELRIGEYRVVEIFYDIDLLKQVVSIYKPISVLIPDNGEDHEASWRNSGQCGGRPHSRREVPQGVGHRDHGPHQSLREDV